MIRPGPATLSDVATPRESLGHRGTTSAIPQHTDHSPQAVVRFTNSYTPCLFRPHYRQVCTGQGLANLIHRYLHTPNIRPPSSGGRRLRASSLVVGITRGGRAQTGYILPLRVSQARINTLPTQHQPIHDEHDCSRERLATEHTHIPVTPQHTDPCAQAITRLTKYSHIPCLLKP